ncbi:probable 3-hydroxyisobutyrate dehydrogenase, mitochondrial isoform X2 [Beta vulgaris subsp. vulgaris]|uniref:probable 3-hydroxyisobutyrate dehydrogenase, mitochondrial isoform X2 n=1 Tax=Beta vulgaris subsp. vulgaris TaxID=3555 RepID=UPI0020371461|nr:probable 3-hydroxyisobutyrate dehydrogenase, mitochondrial isoform X2 [Beta vulgaris subsp. vulgaris]
MGSWKIKLLFSTSKCKLMRNSSVFKLSQSQSQYQGRSFSSLDVQSRLKNVGFIGLGNMGSRMATNLLKSGFRVSVHDMNGVAAKQFVDRGVLVKETPMEIAEASDVVITMLPSSTHVMDVYMGPNGLLHSSSALQPWLFIDSSTIDPLTSRKISLSVSGCALKEKLDCQEKPFMLDAPVSGGILAAEAGSLTFMVGGSEEAYLAAESLFLSMGRDSIYCGGAGNGSVAKICNNLAMAISMIGVSEALAVGQSLGVTASTLSRIFNCSTARCWSSDTYNPVPGVMDGVPSSRDYQGGFASKLMAKDLDIAAASANEAAIKHPLTCQAQDIQDLYQELCRTYTGILPLHDSINCATRAMKRRIFLACSAIIMVERTSNSIEIEPTIIIS